MHIGSYIASLFYFYDFFCRFIVALSDHGTDEWNRTFLMCGRNTQPVHQFQFMFRAVRRQIVNCFPFLYTLMEVAYNVSRRHQIFYAYTFAFFVQRRLWSHPYDCVDRQLITKDNFFVFIYIDNSRKSGTWKSEIIKESGILTITECVIFVIQSALVISEK